MVLWFTGKRILVMEILEILSHFQQSVSVHIILNI